MMGIQAVESVAPLLNEDASATLATALKSLEGKVALHPALKSGSEKLYGYTSDEEGIRHVLHEGSSDVDLHDGVFLLGACASFFTYLIGKARAPD